jgi:hypothetical protein
LIKFGGRGVVMTKAPSAVAIPSIVGAMGVGLADWTFCPSSEHAPCPEYGRQLASR